MDFDKIDDNFETIGDFLEEKCTKDGKVLVCDVGDGAQPIPEPRREVKKTEFTENNLKTLISATSLFSENKEVI